jgi:PAS domain S-box-containing protein
LEKDNKILILENLPTDAELIEMQLRKANVPFSAKRVGTKELFLRVLQEFSPTLVIASNSIPRFDALSALGMAKELTPGIPWVIVSSAPTEDVAVECMKAGAADYVNKRTWARLGPAVKAVLERQPAPQEMPEEKTAEPPKEEPKASPPKEDELAQQILNHASDLIAVVNLDGKRVYNSPSYDRILEDPEVLMGTDSFADIHPEDRQKIKELFFKTIRTGIGQHAEYRLMDKDGETRYIESRGDIIRDANGTPQKVMIVSHDITKHKLQDMTFWDLVIGTAGVTGQEFFTALVRYLAATLDTAYVLVSQCTSPTRERVRSLAYWADGRWEPSFEYDVADTTCELVLKNGTMAYYPERVQELFPKETALVAMKAVCYMGVPLISSSKTVIGHLFTIGRKQLEEPERVTSIMKVFAARASVELERLSEKP